MGKVEKGNLGGWEEIKLENRVNLVKYLNYKFLNWANRHKKRVYYNEWWSRRPKVKVGDLKSMNYRIEINNRFEYLHREEHFW